MSSLKRGGEVGQEGRGVIDDSALDYAIYSVTARGQIKIDEPGVYEFRAILPGIGELAVGTKWGVRGQIENAHQQISLEVAGSVVFGGAAAKLEVGRSYQKRIVPSPVHLQTGVYDVIFRAAPTADSLRYTHRFRIEYRRPGKEGWQNLASIMTSDVPKDVPDDWSPVADQKATITRAGIYGKCKELTVLPDAFVNPVSAPWDGGISVPVHACELTTVELDYNANEPGDHYVMPYVDSPHCMIATTYLRGSTSTAQQIIPSPALKNSGFSGVYTDHVDAYGHMQIKEPGRVHLETRVMCFKDSEMTIFFKRPSAPLMVPW